jgi:virulence factor
MIEIQKTRIALIGLGAIAQKAYLPIVANHAKIESILCTRNTQKLKKLATQYRINEFYSSIEQLIKNRPDAAMIHSTTASHFKITSKLLTAGIPVFVDKPLAFSLKEVEALCNLSEKNKTLLYLGFNRRFAPLISSLKQEAIPNQINWQKNRVNLPDDPRVFVFDDFIHVVDSLLFLGSGSIENLQVFSKLKNNKLGALQVQWQQNKTILNGSMNRISGITEECLEFYTDGNKWKIDDLTSGFHYQNESKLPIGFNNWDNTLYKRGFVNLIEDWLKALTTKFDSTRNVDIWKTHNLCEIIVNKIHT